MKLLKDKKRLCANNSLVKYPLEPSQAALTRISHIKLGIGVLLW